MEEYRGTEETKSTTTTTPFLQIFENPDGSLTRPLIPVSSPAGENHDSTAAPPSAALLSLLPRCLVKGCEGDPLIDRQREFARMLEGAGANVVARLDDKGFHAIELFVPAAAQALFDEVRDFVSTA